MKVFSGSLINQPLHKNQTVLIQSGVLAKFCVEDLWGYPKLQITQPRQLVPLIRKPSLLQEKPNWWSLRRFKDFLFISFWGRTLWFRSSASVILVQGYRGYSPNQRAGSFRLRKFDLFSWKFRKQQVLGSRLPQKRYQVVFRWQLRGL